MGVLNIEKYTDDYAVRIHKLHKHNGFYRARLVSYYSDFFIQVSGVEYSPTFGTLSTTAISQFQQLQDTFLHQLTDGMPNWLDKEISLDDLQSVFSSGLSDKLYVTVDSQAKVFGKQDENEDNLYGDFIIQPLLDVYQDHVEMTYNVIQIRQKMNPNQPMFVDSD
jgi:hypothetical protein